MSEFLNITQFKFLAEIVIGAIAVRQALGQDAEDHQAMTGIVHQGDPDQGQEATDDKFDDRFTCSLWFLFTI